MVISFDNETLNCSEAQSPWDNVVDVTFQFLPVGKSKPPGMLTTHDLSFKYQWNQENRTGTTVYCACYHKKVCISWFLSFFVVSWQNNIHYNMILLGWMSGQSNSGSCPSRSWERRGSWIQIVAVSTPDVHAAVHGPDDAAIYVDYLVVKMKELLDTNPLEALGMCDYMFIKIQIKFTI